MKKTSTVLFINLAMLVLLSCTAMAADCTMSGYDYCQRETRDSGGDAYASAKVYWSLIDNAGHTYATGFPGGYAVGSLKAIVGHTGSHLYRYNNLASWSISCNTGGCSGGSSISDGEITLATPGQTYSQCLVFVAHDYDSGSDGSWAWTWTGTGFLGSNNCFNTKVVGCYDSTSCASSQYCDKSGAWATWNCQAKECETGQTKCEGSTYFTCSNYKWVNAGVTKGQCNVQCTANEEKCEGLDSYGCEALTYLWKLNGPVKGKCGVECTGNDNQCIGAEYQTCSSFKWLSNYNVVGKCGVECTSETKCTGNNYIACENFKFVDKGQVIGQCSVSCLSDLNCPADENVGDKYCDGKNVVQDFKDNSCTGAKCSSGTAPKLVEACKMFCSAGACTNFAFTPITIGIIIAVVLVIAGLIYWAVKRK